MKQLRLFSFVLSVLFVAFVAGATIVFQNQVSAALIIDGTNDSDSTDTSNYETCKSLGDCVDGRICVWPDSQDTTTGALEPRGETCNAVPSSTDYCVYKDDCVDGRRCVWPDGDSSTGYLEPKGEVCQAVTVDRSSYEYCSEAGKCVYGRRCIWPDPQDTSTGSLVNRGAICKSTTTTTSSNTSSTTTSTSPSNTSSSNTSGSSGSSSSNSSSSNSSSTSNTAETALAAEPQLTSITTLPAELENLAAPKVEATDTEIPIVIRTFFTADQYPDPNEGPVEITLYLNNGGGYNSSAAPYDATACVGPGSDTGCGDPNLYTTPDSNNKLLENFQVTGTSFVKDITVNASKLVTFPYTHMGVTKLSYVFHNDKWKYNVGDRNVRIHKIQFYGPGSELLLEYNSDTDSYSGGYDTQQNPLQSLYFDMGTVDMGGTKDESQDGMVNAFDKEEMQAIKGLDTKSLGYWPLGTEGSFNVVSTGLYAKILDAYGGLHPASCVVATNDLYGQPLRHNQSVTLTSVASTDMAEYVYGLYNLDNLNENGNPRPFCVSGEDEIENDGCPEGSDQLKFRTDDPERAMQAFSEYRLPNGKLAQGMWVANQGWTRYSITDGGWKKSSFHNSPGFGKLGIEEHEVHAEDTIPTPNGVQIFLWQGPVEYTMFASYSGDGSGVDFTGVNLQEAVNIVDQPNVFPGEGAVIAQTSIVVEGKLYQLIWRQDGQEFMRKLNLKPDGLPDYSSIVDKEGHGFTATGRRLDEMPGSEGKLQAMDLSLSEDGQSITETMWRGSNKFTRTISIDDKKPIFEFDKVDNFSYASDAVLPSTEGANSITISHEDLYRPDTNNDDKIPSKIAAHAWFYTKTEPSKFIGSNENCVTTFELDNHRAGDYIQDGEVNMADFNQLKDNFFQFSCQHNIIGSDCYINMQDFNIFRDEYRSSLIEKWGKKP